MGKRLAAFAFAMMVLTGYGGSSARASDGSREATRIRLVSLETLLGAKRSLLKAKWTALTQADQQLADLFAADASSAVADPDHQTAAHDKELLKNAARRQALENERFQILQSLQEAYMEIAAIQDEAKRARDELQDSQLALEGHWTLLLMPVGTKGDIFLNQNGTLITGDYKLDNGQTGSLQGTFVNGVMVIERIDARYGKMGRLEGTLAKDGQSVKGTWYSYDFASGQPITGAFSLDRTREEAAP